MNWKEFIEIEKSKDYFKDLEYRLFIEKQSNIVFPDESDIFNAFDYCPFDKTKIVILGQDPYINKGEAHGLAFSIKSGKLPPSLRNIFKELKDDLNIINTSGNLTNWAKQGVLLLNTTLTVRSGKSGSHFGWGWEIFTDNVIKTLANNKNIGFVLWGKHAQAKQNLLKNNMIWKSAHPSPLSAFNGFFGSKPFSKINTWLKSTNNEEINWNL